MTRLVSLNIVKPLRQELHDASLKADWVRLHRTAMKLRGLYECLDEVSPTPHIQGYIPASIMVRRTEIAKSVFEAEIAEAKERREMAARETSSFTRFAMQVGIFMPLLVPCFLALKTTALYFAEHEITALVRATLVSIPLSVAAFFVISEVFHIEPRESVFLRTIKSITRTLDEVYNFFHSMSQ